MNKCMMAILIAGILTGCDGQPSDSTHQAATASGSTMTAHEESPREEPKTSSEAREEDFKAGIEATADNSKRCEGIASPATFDAEHTRGGRNWYSIGMDADTGVLYLVKPFDTSAITAPPQSDAESLARLNVLTKVGLFTRQDGEDTFLRESGHIPGQEDTFTSYKIPIAIYTPTDEGRKYLKKGMDNMLLCLPGTKIKVDNFTDPVQDGEFLVSHVMFHEVAGDEWPSFMNDSDVRQALPLLGRIAEGHGPQSEIRMAKTHNGWRTLQ